MRRSPTARPNPRTPAATALTLIGALALLVALPAHPEVYGRRVLGLYKSSEGQTAAENEILYHLSGPLAEMGLTVDYWDADSGLPPESALRDVRAVISWFRGPSIAHPQDYLRFLNRTADSGRKLIVLDNLGAYQDRSSGRYLDTGLVNLTLGRLGLMYLGDWTEDPSVIRVASKDGAVVEKGGQQDPEVSRFYYRFYPVDRDLEVYLSLERTDRDYGSSPVISSNANGGFALSRYIYHYTDGRVTMLLDLRSFLRKALFPEPQGEHIALLADTDDLPALRILGYARSVLQRARIPCDVIPREEFPRLIQGDLGRFTTVGLILKDDAGLDPALLEAYLREGGSLVSLLGGSFRRLAPVLSLSAEPAPRSFTRGYRFRFGFLLGEGLSLEESTVQWKPGAHLPTEDVEILGQDFQGSIPLLWTARKHGGRVLVWNWDAHAIGEFLGPMLESFLYVRPVGVAATPGLGIMMIDDWPLPMYDVVKDPLEVTDTEFYTRRFWPDIRDFLDAEGIPFTSYIVFNYNARTEPPFSGGEFFAAQGMASLGMAREILAQGREMGFHGYNHLSLTLEDTQVNLHPWPSVAAMRQSVEESRREWISLLGAHTLPFSYVPVNNIISRDGEAALLAGYPSIKVIAPLRFGVGDVTTKPFGPHPDFPDVYYIPRTSWGYPFSPYMRQLITSAVAGEGIWAHYIHPDDVFDPSRSQGLGWEDLLSGFQSMVRFVKRQYPWLRYVTVRQAYELLRRTGSAGVEYRWDGEDLLIASEPGMLFRLRLNDRRLGSVSGGRIVHEYNRPSEVILETTENATRVSFR